MARPIRPTPWLDKESSRVFREKISEERSVEVRPPETPNIEKAIQMIVSDASDKAK